MTLSTFGPVRGELIHATRKIHDALHGDPLLACLTRSNLTAHAYERALSVFAQFYFAMETARDDTDLFPEFGLKAECLALKRDVPSATLRVHRFSVQGRPELMGALYVAHGAAFGRNSMRANVVSMLPNAPHHFLRCPTPSHRWSTLTSRLEQIGHDACARKRMIRGADQAFSFIAEISKLEQSRLECES
ncbi:biliverdin-producing heme oxygenase [Tateyamaria omphalii]|uniref:biliverdin-producing heme oxygenase n=1 Tax=Tateyamaria omphalii TaxID=299262 RepID=UPI001C98E642|nr:biliverdin-producing heme oxygenase [Tateyamaria omphalii]MBY5933946.1 biliverdin-producing heme oxygenase [Tateyamaria omphalii]